MNSDFSIYLGNALTSKTTKDLAETFAYHVGNGFSIPWLFATDYDLVFEQLVLLIPPRIYYLLITHIFNTQSIFKSQQRKKDEENKTTNESTWIIFVARFSFDVLASLIFVICFVISFASTNNLLKHCGIILNFILFLLF